MWRRSPSSRPRTRTTADRDPRTTFGGDPALFFRLCQLFEDLLVVALILADLFDKLDIRIQPVPHLRRRPGLRVGDRILDRDVDGDVRVHATDALGDLQGFAVWVAHPIEPASVIEPDGL